MINRDISPASRAFRRPPANAAVTHRVRHKPAAATQRRPDRDHARSRGYVHVDPHVRFEPGWRPARRRSSFDLGVLLLSGGLIGAAAGCFWLLYSVFGTSEMDAPQAAVQTSVTDGYAAASLPDSSPAEVVRTHKADMLARYGHPVVVSSNEAEAVKAIEHMVRTSAPAARRAPSRLEPDVRIDVSIAARARMIAVGTALRCRGRRGVAYAKVRGRARSGPAKRARRRADIPVDH